MLKKLIEKNEIEFWSSLNYKDIIPGMYKISSLGKIINKKSNSYLYGCNPDNEKGYVRVTLQTIDGYRKFPLHKLVLGTFTEFKNDLEVNHIDGNKTNNKLSNLEYTTRKENAEHAALNGLYKSCGDHYHASLTNIQVEKICKYMQQGLANVEIAKLMDLEYTDSIQYIISSIRTRKNWRNISKKYTWPSELVYKKYTKEDIQLMCQYLFIEHIKMKEIVQLFPQYEPKKLMNVLKKINQGKLYKSIAESCRKFND